MIKDGKNRMELSHAEPTLVAALEKVYIISRLGFSSKEPSYRDFIMLLSENI